MNPSIRFLGALLALVVPAGALAAGTLTPAGSPDAPIEIRDHAVRVVLNNGFARTEVTQSFYNPNPTDLEGVYAFPVPISASLSEVAIVSGEREIHGEVVDKASAERIYQEEKSQGNDAGLASNDTQTFEFRVSPIRSRAETQLRFVYYQPLEIDTAVGRYLYPLEDGGTDELAKSFWTPNEKVDGSFSIELELKSAWPVADLRVPGFENQAQLDEIGDGHYRVRIERQDASLDRDFVFYYRLADDLPGRVEMIPYRAAADRPGSFMLVVTPGLDLQPITGGADYVFVLDVSGSMAGKIATLGQGVSKALGEMDPGDRFRIVTFANGDDELTRGWVPATPENVRHWAQEVQQLQPRGGTNMYAGISRALKNLDDDRATSVVLVTDAVTNRGVVEPKQFKQLMQNYDVRFFGFLMGNSANWPLMRLIADTSGGFYAQISNADDVIGQLLLAKSKITHEALHDAQLEIRGVKTFDTTGEVVGKVYRGQQLVLFGRYDGSGPATLELRARLTGEDKTYRTSFDFPEVDTGSPEIERLWALARIESIETLAQGGLLPGEEAADAVRDLGVAYQLVTDETSMVVLDDDAFQRHGIERRNRARTAVEHAAQAQRAAQPVRNHRVDAPKPMFEGRRAPSGVGGGAIDPLTGGLGLALAAAALRARRRHARRERTPVTPEGHGPPWLTLGLCAVALVVAQWPGAGPALAFERGAVDAGEWWRLLTGHWVHWSPEHLLWDVGTFAALGIPCEQRSRGRFAVCVAVSAVAISLVVWLGLTQLALYGGLSGIDCALFALLGAELWRERHGRDRRGAAWLAAALGLALVLKVGFEWSSGGTVFAGLGAGVVPVPAAHATGALLGIAVPVLGWRAQPAAA